MTDGLYEASTPMGDVRFHEYSTINPAVADRWKDVEDDDFLGDPTWQLAGLFGYEAPRKNDPRREQMQRRRDRRIRSRRQHTEQEFSDAQ